MSENSKHNSRHFVIQKGRAICNQGNLSPQFRVTSHRKHYWNDEAGQPDFLAVTEDDVQFSPSGASFGQCRLKPSSGGYLPCTFAPAGKWQNTYEKVKVMGKACVTEVSELMCTVGGTVTVKDHGQTTSLGIHQIKNTDAKEQYLINPILDESQFREAKDDDIEICE